MSKFLIIANWKANPDKLSEAINLAKKTEVGVSAARNIEVVIAPPFPFLPEVKKVIKKVRLGAQDAFSDSGPFTGEVSWKELSDLGVEYALVGHSERRSILGESNEIINRKIKALLKNKIKTVLCVGEKERSGAEIPEEVGDQLKKDLEDVRPADIKNLIIAYEPIWAISTNPEAKADTPANAFQALIYIRKILTALFGANSIKGVRIIYGGSVRSGNIVSFLEDGKMEGALVGGASLNIQEFSEIVSKASAI